MNRTYASNCTALAIAIWALLLCAGCSDWPSRDEVCYPDEHMSDNGNCGCTNLPCNAGWQCLAGKCTCSPVCAGKACGPDGCGGICGECASDESCNSAGYCVPACGDGLCDEVTEDACDCPADCTPVCGDDCCTGTESACNCVDDCGDPDCAGKDCGDDGCGGSCGECGLGLACNAEGECVKECLPDCTGKDCGNDGCGKSCGECTAGFSCTPEGKCVEICVPNCTDKDCGDDGCGKSCGECTAGFSCTPEGKCVEICVPNCTDKECGDDGCGKSCGECTAGFSCAPEGKCVEICVPNCTDKDCGDDGCGKSCGECTAGFSCEVGACVGISVCLTPQDLACDTCSSQSHCWEEASELGGTWRACGTDCNEDKDCPEEWICVVADATKTNCKPLETETCSDNSKESSICGIVIDSKTCGDYTCTVCQSASGLSSAKCLGPGGSKCGSGGGLAPWVKYCKDGVWVEISDCFDTCCNTFCAETTKSASGQCGSVECASPGGKDGQVCTGVCLCQ